MKIVCPNCSKEHRVREQMAGKRAKCSCGNVLTIPAVSSLPSESMDPPNDPVNHISPVDREAGQGSDSAILFQCNYGLVRPFMWWLLVGNLLVALFLIPAGFLWSEGWVVARSPIHPLVATLFFEAVGFGLLLLIAYMLAAYWLHRGSPQRVAVTATGLILPKSKLSTQELSLPWDQVRARCWGGPVTTLDFKLGGFRNVRLVSIQFATDEDFDTFLDHLHEHDKL